MTIPRAHLNVNPNPILVEADQLINPTNPEDSPDQIEKDLKSYDNRDIRVYVHVTRNPTNRQLHIRCSHPLPIMSSLIPFMPDRDASRVRDYSLSNYTVDQVINQGYFSLNTPAAWQDLLVKELTARICGLNDNPTPYEANPFSTPAYLTVGGTLYKLQPEAQVKTSGALKSLRKRITAEAESHSKTIRANADQYHREKTLEADRKLADAKRKYDDLKKSGKLIPPQLAVASGFPVKYMTRAETPMWAIALNLNIHFKSLYFKWEDVKVDSTTRRTSVTHTWKKWHIPQASQTIIKVRAWVPILDPLKGTYNMSAIHIDELDPNLPHISHDSACMAPATAPSILTTLEHLVQLQHAIQTCLEVVDYSSPLVKYGYWSEAIRKPWPDALRVALNNPESPTNALRRLAASEEGTYDPIKDDTETWKAS
jgi:hypothetical protein